VAVTTVVTDYDVALNELARNRNSRELLSYARVNGAKSLPSEKRLSRRSSEVRISRARAHISGSAFSWRRGRVIAASSSVAGQALWMNFSRLTTRGSQIGKLKKRKVGSNDYEAVAKTGLVRSSVIVTACFITFTT
jgi:hypothetical protein